MFNLESLFLLTPATIAFYVLAALLVLFYAVASLRSATESRRIQAVLLAIAQQQLRQSVTFVVDVRVASSDIIPLLNHLFEQASDASVVVRVHPASGTRLRSVLLRYRRDTQLGSKLRIISYRPGMKQTTFVKRYVTGEVIVPIEAYQRLSREFTRYLTLAFLDERVQAVQLRRFRKPQVSLMSAFQSLEYQWAASLHEGVMPRLPRQSALKTGVAVRKKFAASGAAYRPKYVLSDRFGLDDTLYSPPMSFASLFRAVAVFTVATTLYLMVASSPTLASFIGPLVIGLVVLTAIVSIIGPRGLSSAEKISLVFLVPFYPPYLLVDALRTLSVLVYKSVVSGVGKALTLRKNAV